MAKVMNLFHAKNRGLQSSRLAANVSPSSCAEMILKKDLKRAEGAKEEC